MEAKAFDWTKAKRQTLEQISKLPSLETVDILAQYTLLLEALKEDEIKTMDTKLKLFVLQSRFPEFALAYGALFNLACRRECPYTVEKVQEIMRISNERVQGNISEEKARGYCMDLAEKDRREREEGHL